MTGRQGIEAKCNELKKENAMIRLKQLVNKIWQRVAVDFLAEFGGVRVGVDRSRRLDDGTGASIRLARLVIFRKI